MYRHIPFHCPAKFCIKTENLLASFHTGTVARFQVLFSTSDVLFGIFSHNLFQHFNIFFFQLAWLDNFSLRSELKKPAEERFGMFRFYLHSYGKILFASSENETAEYAPENERLDSDTIIDKDGNVLFGVSALGTLQH